VSSQRVTAIPAHPDRKQDDSTRQVSWLPGPRSRPPSRSMTPQWSSDDRSPVTVAGAAAAFTAFPV